MTKIVSVAPMMDCTDRHEIYFLSLISPNVELFTEMIVSNAIIKGDKDKLLKFKKIKNRVVLQLGGSNPKELAEAAKIGEDYGYSEINLNLGCPSKKVQKNKFGACLMKEPELVAECVQAIIKSINIPFSVKTRIGYDHVEDYPSFENFILKLYEAGCRKFIIHARKAMLGKFTPKQNLNIPKLNYDFVYKIKARLKDCYISLNGGVTTTQEIENHLKVVDGVMIGRAIYHSPYFLAEIEEKIFGSKSIPSRTEIIENLIPYIKSETKEGAQLNHIMRHTIGLFHGQAGAKRWKQFLSNNMCIRNADLQKVNHIMDVINNNSPNLER